MMHGQTNIKFYSNYSVFLLGTPHLMTIRNTEMQLASIQLVVIVGDSESV